MGQLRRLRTTPAFFVAVAALVVAGSGIGYAAGQIGTTDLKDGAVTSRKIRNETIKTVDLAPATIASLRGATGPAGPAGPAGQDGADGAPGPAGADGQNGTARAYAHVSNAGELVAARSSGFEAVTEPANGVYCMTLSDATIDPANIAPSATVEFSGSSGIGHIVSVDYRVDSCAEGADFTVNTMSFTGASFAWSGGIAFTVLVP